MGYSRKNQTVGFEDNKVLPLVAQPNCVNLSEILGPKKTKTPGNST